MSIDDIGGHGLLDILDHPAASKVMREFARELQANASATYEHGEKSTLTLQLQCDRVGDGLTWTIKPPKAKRPGLASEAIEMSAQPVREDENDDTSRVVGVLMQPRQLSMADVVDLQPRKPGKLRN